jgi:hypothetical protein
VRRSRLKKQLKAKAARSRAKIAKMGARRLVIGDVTFTFRIGKGFTDIRGPNEKWLVPHWTLNKMTQAEYEAVPWEDCTTCDCISCDSGYCHRSLSLCITPGKIAEFLIANSPEASKANSRQQAALAAAKLATYPARRSHRRPA